MTQDDASLCAAPGLVGTREVAVPVASPDLGYTVQVGRGLLAQLGQLVLRHKAAGARVALISDDQVAPLYGPLVRASLEAAGFGVQLFVVPAGEASKNPAQLQSLIEGMIDADFSRKDLVLTLGGGVVGDLGGLAAASFMRGVDFIQVPTSLLAQVDASVGGKVAIDLPAGKNLWGAFHFPRAVVIDPDCLGTLSPGHLRSGMAEMFKHGALFSAAHFEELAELSPALLALEGETVARLVAESVGFKASCVSADPREHAQHERGRVVLNLGHTVGHALESLSDYELFHGEAVALGMLACARVSVAHAGASPDLEEQMRRVFEVAGLPTDLDAWVRKVGEGALCTFMKRDKKRHRDGDLSFVALAALGEPRLIRLRAEEIAALLRR